MYFLTMKLSVILQMIEKPKYKTKQYYKKCVTQKTLETKQNIKQNIT